MITCGLSIIIITLNEEARLPRLLDDLLAQSFQDFEVIHVDSQSEDRTVAISNARKHLFARYQIIEMNDRGVSLGRNTGASAASGRRLLFLDADTRLKNDFLAESVAEVDRAGAGVGIPQMSADGLRWHYRVGFGAFNLGIKASSFVYPTAVGACLFSPPDIHVAIGGFDPEISLCEDCNYVLKAFRLNKQPNRVLQSKFSFDPRRLEQDGFVATGLIYLKANLHRALVGEIRDREIDYPFGHYQ